jgi:hypothetical protein
MKPSKTLKRNTPYEGGDPLMDWHKAKTKSSMSEAFRDADYACAVWKCPTDFDRTKEYLTWVVLWAFFLGGMYLMMVFFDAVVTP